jgi:hypothetical protein
MLLEKREGIVILLAVVVVYRILKRINIRAVDTQVFGRSSDRTASLHQHGKQQYLYQGPNPERGVLSCTHDLFFWFKLKRRVIILTDYAARAGTNNLISKTFS